LPEVFRVRSRGVTCTAVAILVWLLLVGAVESVLPVHGTVDPDPRGVMTYCSRCGRRPRDDTGWNVALEDGYAVGFICPECQTAEESVQAELNDAILDYSVDDEGRLWGTLKE
jgi:hypothetical protein